MSEVSDAATVRLLIADYASADTAGKLALVGGLITVLGGNPAIPGMTAPLWLAVWVSVPPAHYGTQCSISIVLEDSSGEPVAMPGPQGQAQPVQIVQDVRFTEPVFPESFAVPGNPLPARAQMVVAFGFGLPLAPDQTYAWRVKVDGESHYDWVEEFFVAGLATNPADAAASLPTDSPTPTP